MSLYKALFLLSSLLLANPPSTPEENLLAAARPHKAHLFRINGHPVALVPQGPAPFLTLSDDWAPIEGYQGLSRLALWVDADGTLSALTLLDSKDTPAYVRRIKKSDLLKRIQDAVNQTPAPGVDGLSGATLTSRAIDQSVRDALEGFRPLLKHLHVSGDQVTATGTSVKVEDLRNP